MTPTEARARIATAQRIAELEEALSIIVRGATSTMGYDSTGREYAHVRQVMLDRGRAVLGMPAQEGRDTWSVRKH